MKKIYLSFSFISLLSFYLLVLKVKQEEKKRLPTEEITHRAERETLLCCLCSNSENLRFSIHCTWCFRSPDVTSKWAFIVTLEQLNILSKENIVGTNMKKRTWNEENQVIFCMTNSETLNAFPFYDNRSMKLEIMKCDQVSSWFVVCIL